MLALSVFRFFSACHRSYMLCMLIHISLLVFKAKDNLTAISGLIPDFLLSILDNVTRPTPNAFAASVIVNLAPSINIRFTTSPGCGGLCININSCLLTNGNQHNQLKLRLLLQIEK